jgi:nitroreductase
MSENTTPSKEELNRQKTAPVERMLPVLAERWSPRAFAETAVPAADLKIILEAARWTASSGNSQPWRFLVGIKGSETHDKIYSTLVGFNQAWAGKAGVLILGFAELKNPKGEAVPYALYDLGQSAVSLVTQASALGLHTHSMAGFDHAKAKEIFGLTEDQGLGAVIAVGYQADPSTISDENMLQREVAPRERKALSEIALTAPGTPLNFQ